MIFHRFVNLTAAAAFAYEASERGLDSVIYTNADAAADADCFPFQLTAPVVLVERDSEEVERELEALVRGFHGEFAGT